MPETFYTKEEVETLIKEIIHQDSYGDTHYKANEIAQREGLNLDKRTFIGDLNEE